MFPVAIGRACALDSGVGPADKGATLPAKVTQDFFVVGGPVQPDRRCYVRRKADEHLLEAIAAGRFAYVLAPKASGKSSLMGRAIRRLRADGQLAAVVDLTQIGMRRDGVDSARWHYSIAYRICRELRIRIDLQSWWHERAMLMNEQRLVEFFWDVVLAHTTEPVTIFFDDVERAVDLPLSMELFAALNSAYMRRVSEPEYARLNFVALGVAAPEQLCPDPTVSPFVEGRAIGLGDFTLEECRTLVQEFELPEEATAELLERIYGLTRGQPYLTQKLLRAVWRRGGALTDVGSASQEVMPAAGVRRDEPLITYMRGLLSSGKRGRQAATVLRRLARGGEVIFDPHSPVQALLHYGGFISSDENGMLRFRNRIVEHAFEPGSIVSIRRSRTQRTAIAGAGALVVVALISFWYLRILPRPYIDTLSLVSSDYALAEQAYRRLHSLPGFGARADSLLEAVLVRQSNAATTLTEATAASDALRRLPDREALADELLARFWFRQSRSAALTGQRDAALVYSIAAARAGSGEGHALAANLIDGDYALLEQSFHFDAAVLDLQVDWERGRLTVIDAEGRLHSREFRASPGSTESSLRPAAGNPGIRLTAPQHVGASRVLFVDEPGIAGSIQLRVAVDHPRSSDLSLRLRAPGGAIAELELPRRAGARERFVFTGATNSDLLRLADESITGYWELTLFDRLSGETGRLLGWGLSFPGVSQFWDDDPVDGIEVPDPVETAQVKVALSGDGRRSVAVPARGDARGAATVWDVENDTLIATVPLADSASFVEFVGHDRLLIVGPARASLWLIEGSERIAERIALSGFSARPVVSPNGSHFFTTEPAGSGIELRLFNADDGRLAGRFVTTPWRDWSLADDAIYLATVDNARRGQLLDAYSGEPFAEFFHDREIESVVAGAEHVVIIDERGGIFSWQYEENKRTYGPLESIWLGTTSDAASVAVSTDSSLLTFVDTDGLVNVSRLRDGYRDAVYGHGQAPVSRARVSPEGDSLMSSAGQEVRFWRRPAPASGAHSFGDVSAAALAPTGDVAIVGYRSGQVHLVHDLETALAGGIDHSSDSPGHLGSVTSVIFNSDGSLAASGGSDGRVRIWDTQTGLPVPYLTSHPSGPVVALQFDAQNQWLVSGGPGSARVFSLETGSVVHEIEVEGFAQAVAISPDGLTLAVGDSEGNVMLTAADGSQGVRTLRFPSPVTALAMQAGSDVLASGGADGTLVFWDTLEARALQSAERFNGPIRWIRFHASSGQVVLQNGGWLSALAQSDGEFEVVRSRLLPSRFRNGSHLTQLQDSTVTALVIAGGGHLVQAEIDLPTSDNGAVGPDADGPAAVSRAASAGLADRDWMAILGLELDPTSGNVRISGR